jgi:hypothetical protein
MSVSLYVFRAPLSHAISRSMMSLKWSMLSSGKKGGVFLWFFPCIGTVPIPTGSLMLALRRRPRPVVLAGPKALDSPGWSWRVPLHFSVATRWLVVCCAASAPLRQRWQEGDWKPHRDYTQSASYFADINVTAMKQDAPIIAEVPFSPSTSSLPCTSPR